MGSLYVCFFLIKGEEPHRQNLTRLVKYSLTPDSVDDYINDASSTDMPSSLFESSAPTFESEDDSDFTSALLLMIGCVYTQI